MIKFKVGDTVRVVNAGATYSNCSPSRISSCDETNWIEHRAAYDGNISKEEFLILAIEDAGSYDRLVIDNGAERFVIGERGLELITKGGAPMARKTYKLIKDTPTMVKGAILQEQCDDGTQPYIMLNNDTHCKDPSYRISIAKRELVEDQPKWFVEVFQVEPQYMTRDELDQWEAFKTTKTRKSVAVKSAPVDTNPKSAWTPARRKAHSAKIKAAWAAKKNAA